MSIILTRSKKISSFVNAFCGSDTVGDVVLCSGVGAGGCGVGAEDVCWVLLFEE